MMTNLLRKEKLLFGIFVISIQPTYYFYEVTESDLDKILDPKE